MCWCIASILDDVPDNNDNLMNKVQHIQKNVYKNLRKCSKIYIMSKVMQTNERISASMHIQKTKCKKILHKMHKNETGKGLPNQKEDVKNETVYLYNQG